MKKKLILLCTALVALVLEILPYGAVCIFAPSPEERIRKMFSYFDPIPFGYANFAPFIVGLLTCVLIILIILALILKKELKVPIIVVSAVATILSIAPLFYGTSYFSVVGIFITLSLLTTTIVSCIKTKAIDKDKT